MSSFRGFVLALLCGAVAYGCGIRPRSFNGVTVSGSVKDALYRTPVPNTEVCIIEPDLGCTHTNPLGEFDFIDVPPRSRLLVRFLRGGYYPNVAHYSVGDGDEFLTYLLTSEQLSDLAAELAHVRRDDAMSIIVFSARTGRGPDAENVEDVAVSLEPAQGDGPFYAVQNGFDDSRTATTSVGGGVIFNVPPGTATVRYTHADRRCAPYYGWEGPDAGTLTVRLLEGYSTYISQVCTPP
ncbi:MAG: hypothetical protein HY904_04870 [Deltaproteobacteria bacterium]|nr:hypothetical protein [Deltaproteobacteria bacterium]